MPECCPESELVDGTAQLFVEDDCTVVVEVEAGGPPGPQGPAASISVGTTTTLAPGSSATVANSGTSGAAIFDFGIPEGEQGIQGSQGAVGSQGATGSQGPIGPQGNTGTAATVSVGTTSTLAPGSSATVGNSGTSSAAIFDFGIPEGVQGSVGPQGSQGPQGAEGQSSSFYNYKIKTTLTSGDPGNTHLIYNNATQISATQINISHIDKDGYDIDIFLALIKDGDKIIIQDAGDSNDFQKWEVNGTPTLQVGYVEVPVVLVTSGGDGTTNFGNNLEVIVALASIGPQGPQGPQGSQGPSGSAATVNVGTTTTLAPGSSATVGNSGTTSAAVFDFGIPEGVQGSQGPSGPQGADAVEVVVLSDFVDPYSYMGVAPQGSATSSPVWRVTRIDIGPPVVAELADPIEWDDRLTAIYT